MRSNGFVIGYNEGEPFWAKYRAMLYEPSYKTIVFIGSSHIKYDLNVDSWENITGEKAIQLGAK